jgi:nucleotide-binding universal stress UspA family protein
MYKSILLAYDGSIEGVRALREGALLAHTCGARVVLLSVIPDRTSAVEMAQGAGDAVGGQIDGYKQLLHQAVAWLKERNFDAEPRLVIGDPARSIGAVAKEISADLVVVGHHRKGFLSRWWSGSTRDYLSDHVSCSILIACAATSVEDFEAALQKSKIG